MPVAPVLDKKRWKAIDQWECDYEMRCDAIDVAMRSHAISPGLARTHRRMSKKEITLLRFSLCS